MFIYRCVCDPDFEYTPIMPQKVIHEINVFIGDDTIFTTDIGQNQMWAIHYLNIEKPRRFLFFGTFGSMGYGLPTAIGAKAVKPDMDVMCITGNRGFQMVMQEVATSLANDLSVTVLLLNNDILEMVRQWQKFFRNECYSVTTLKCDLNFVKMVEAFGAKDIHVEMPGEIQDAFKKARDYGKICVVYIGVNPTNTSSL